MQRLVAGLLLAGLLASAQTPGQNAFARLQASVGKLENSLTLASMTLRLHQFLNTVTDAQRRAQLAALAGHWYRSGVSPTVLAQWNASFDQASEGVFSRVEALARNTPNREGALRAVQTARARLDFQRAMGEDLTLPLSEVLEVLDQGQPAARMAGWFDGIDEEVEGLLVAEASMAPQSASSPAGPGITPRAMAPAAALAQAATPRQNLAFGKTAAWDIDLQREQPLDEIVILVRPEYANRLPAFQVYLASDGSNWRAAYSGGGAGAYGRPVVVRLNGERARRVAVTWAQADVNPFDRIDVYAGGSPVTPATPSTPAVAPPTPPSQAPGAQPVTPAAQATPGSNTNLALGRPTRTSSRSAYSTPAEAGGVDGIKNGMFGFHTSNEPNPWWDVDLQQTVTLGEIRIFNRRENLTDVERSRTLRALLSLDGVIWQPVHDQGGRTFGMDGQPLRIMLNGVPARWVRLQLNESNYLHLDEVEVYAAGGPTTAGAGANSDGSTAFPPQTGVANPSPALASPDPATNLALGRPTRTSSRSSYSSPSENGGVDGVKNGRFGFHTNNEPNPWWEVDLQQTVALGEILIFNNLENAVVADRSKTLRALVSLDGVNWQTVYDHNGRSFGLDGLPLRIRLMSVPARWVRLQLREANWLHLDEVEVYAAAPATSSPPVLSTPDPSINLAFRKPTSTSSRSSYSTPSESGGVDGVKNGMFGFHTNNEANPWWGVDLQQTVALGEIRVFNYRENAVVADRSRTLRALVSLDGSNWQMVYNQNGRSFGGDGQPLRILINGVPARYVRLQLNEANWLHLDEVEVYAASAGTTTSGQGGGPTLPGGGSGAPGNNGAGVGAGPNSGGPCADSRTMGLMDQWLAQARPVQRPGDSLRYEPWGRLVGRTATAVIQTPYPPDTRLTRCQWLWQYSPQMNSTNLGTLLDFLTRNLR